MSNLPHRNDSSGSDEDSGYEKPGRIEVHHNAGCRFTKYKTVISGHIVYVWLRSCFCEEDYKSYDIRQGVTSLVTDMYNGVDVHFSAQCKWRKHKKNGGWELNRKCVSCVPPKLASYTGNHSDSCSPC